MPRGVRLKLFGRVERTRSSTRRDGANDVVTLTMSAGTQDVVVTHTVRGKEVDIFVRVPPGLDLELGQVWCGVAGEQ